MPADARTAFTSYEVLAALTGCIAVLMTVMAFRGDLRTVLEANLWGVFRLRHSADAQAYHVHGVHSYKQMRDVRSRGWVACTIKEVERAALAREARTHGLVLPFSMRNTGRVMLAMTPEVFRGFSGADCDVWVDEPEVAQDWFEVFGQRAPRLFQAGLSLPEAIALDGQGRLDDESVDTLAALLAPAV